MKHIRLLVVLALVFVVLAVPLMLFFIRPPVLVVTDVNFVALYGAERLKRQQYATSITLFRRVKPVMVVDGAGPDILLFAIAEAAVQPFCVLFPRTQSQAAERYHEMFPQIPAVVISGHASASALPSPDGILCVYGTDRRTDLYRAGYFAGILGTEALKSAETAKSDNEAAPAQSSETRRTYALWQDRYVQAEGREFFLKGVRELDPESNVVFVSSAGQMPGTKALSCVVLTGAGAEYLEHNPPIPLILFSWLDPSFTSKEVTVIFDDSPWALIVPAVQMAVQGQAKGIIPSEPLILSKRVPGDSISRILKNSAKKMP